MTYIHKIGSLAILAFTAFLMAPADCGPSGTPGMGSMEADIDGDHWSAGNCNINEIGSQEIVTITGADAAGSVLECSLIGITSTATLDLASDDAPGGNCSWTPEEDIGGSFGSVSGTLDITTYDDEIVEGTFDFVGEDPDGNTVDVTNGEFHCEWGINPLG